jgi:hypothetical protein
MSYQGRSPLKDVARSVVIGAGMISPALLQHCATPSGRPPEIPLDGTASTTPTGTTMAVASTPPAESAPPNDVVRPRPSPTGTQMPTRGFAGAARARG